MSRLAWRLALALVSCSAVVAAAAPPAPGKRGRVEPPPHSISRDNMVRARSRLAARAPAAAKLAAADTVRLVALRIDFPDLAFGQSPPADELHDRFYYQNQFHYVAQYYATASAGALVLQIDVPDVVARAAHPQADYGDVAVYDSSMVELAGEAVRASDASVDFAAYDGVLLVHAGPGQESDVLGDSDTQIWSGFIDDGTFQEQLSSPDTTITGIATGDGATVRNIVVLPEWEVQDLQATGGTRLGSLGVYCHEIGQRLGMIPLFDASPPFPDSQGLGNFDVMAYGLWVANGFIPSLPSAFNRVLMGWLHPIEVRAAQEVLLRDQERGAADSTVARVWISPREYFLVSYALEDPDGPVIKTCNGVPDGPRRFFEFEDANGNCRFDYTDENADGVLSPGDLIDSYAGAEWDFFMTDFQGGATAGQGSGLLVLHVDEQVLQEVLDRGSTNVEGDASRKAVDVEEADGIQDLDRGPDNVRSFGSADDYWQRSHVFGPQTVPDTRSTNGAPTGIAITLVAQPDSAASGPGGRARVRVDFGATGSTGVEPSRRAWRDFAGDAGAEPVTMYDTAPRGPLVVPADDGRVLLLGPDLEGWPAKADPAPWVQVPSALRGAWIGAPASGAIVPGSTRHGVVLAAEADSAGVTQSRLFAWSDLGVEIRDLDANPLTNSGVFATLPGRATAPVVLRLDATSGNDAVCAGWDADGAAHVATWFAGASAWTRRDVASPGRLGGGPIGVRAAGDASQTWLAWAVCDSAAGALRLVVQPGATGATSETVVADAVPRGPVRLAAANLDAQGDEELIVAAAGLGLDVWARQTATGGGVSLVRRSHTTLAGTSLSPLALADVDGDGTLEILVASESALHVLSNSGAELRGWPVAFAHEPGLADEPRPGSGVGSPLVADFDGDGASEIFVHLPGGAALAWNARGERRRDLEAALPARGVFTPLVANLDGDAGLELVAVGRFDAASRYVAPRDSLVVLRRSQIAVWTFPRGRAVAWGELGGGPGHAFHDTTVRNVQAVANDPGLGSFVVGPNPAAEEVRARVTLTAPAEVHCRLFDLEGEIVREASATGTAGSVVELVFDLRGLASGVYLAQLDLSTGGRRTRPVAVRR